MRVGERRGEGKGHSCFVGGVVEGAHEGFDLSVMAGRAQHEAATQTTNPKTRTTNPNHQTQKPKLQTQNTKLKTQNSKLRTHNTKTHTQTSIHKTQNPHTNLVVKSSPPTQGKSSGHTCMHSSHVTRHTDQRNTSHGTEEHVTRHTSHITHHTSHITHHTSHITHHTAGAVKVMSRGGAAPGTLCSQCT